jgi:hypothetical protein
VVLLASLAMAFGLRVLALPAALVVLIGWPFLVYGLHLPSGSFFVVAFSLPAIWASWRYRTLTAEERWRLAGMERFWEKSQTPWTLQDAADHATLGMILMAFSGTLDLVRRGHWGFGLALGIALGLITWGLRNRERWALIGVIVVVPISIWMSRDSISHWTYAAIYLSPAAWVFVRARHREQ